MANGTMIDSLDGFDAFFASPAAVGGTAFLAAAFAILWIVNTWMGFRYRMGLYSLVMGTGLLLEVMAYVFAAVHMGSYMGFMFGTIMGPTFITAAIYFVLPRVLVVYGKDVSVISQPVWIWFVFLAFDIFTAAFQAVGCKFSAGAIDAAQQSQGANVLVAGLGIQLASLLVFFGVFSWFLIRLFQRRHLLDPLYCEIYLSARFKIFLLCLQLASILILIRTVARIVIILLNLSQVIILIFDGGAVLIAALILTIASPGQAFTANGWIKTSPFYDRRARGARPRSLPLEYQRSPYYNPVQQHSGTYPPSGGSTWSPYSYGAPYYHHHQQSQQQSPPYNEGQTPGHWQVTGFAKPVAGRPMAVHDITAGRKDAVEEMETAARSEVSRRVSHRRHDSQISWPTQDSPGLTLSDGGASRTSPRHVPERPERNTTVDPEALWE